MDTIESILKYFVQHPVDSYILVSGIVIALYGMFIPVLIILHPKLPLIKVSIPLIIVVVSWIILLTIEMILDRPLQLTNLILDNN